MRISDVVAMIFNIYYFVLLARIILSWVPIKPKNDILRSAIRLVYDLTEPYLSIFRKWLPIADMGGVGIDFSPIIAFIVFGIARYLIVGALIEQGL